MISNYQCPLCEEKNLNKRLSNTSLYWIAKCDICGKIIVVYQEHVKQVEVYVVDEMKQECRRLFDSCNYKISFKNQHVDGHFHFHLEPLKEEVLESIPEVQDNVMPEEEVKEKREYKKKKKKKKKEKVKAIPEVPVEPLSEPQEEPPVEIPLETQEQ